MIDMLNFNTASRIGINSTLPVSFSDSLSTEKDIFNPFNNGLNLSLHNNFISSLMLFDLFTSNKMPLRLQSEIITSNFNTKTNLPALRSVYNPELGNAFANIANRNARSTGTIGWCLRGVRRALEKAELHLGGSMGASAYQSLNSLSNNRNFKQVQVSRNELKSLPAGCIIIWDRNSRNRHGHIAVTLGNGKEASDHVQNLITTINAGFTVFAPTGTNLRA